jgi:hypothetical protein
MTDPTPYIGQVIEAARDQFEAYAAVRNEEVNQLIAEREEVVLQREQAIAQRDEIQAKYDAHMATHEPTEPEPEPATVLIGANYGGGDESQFHGRPEVARVFLQTTVPTDIKNQDDYKRAYSQGVRAFVISWKSTNTSALKAMLESAHDDVKLWGCYFHEPEDNIKTGSLTLANWKRITGEQAAMMKSIGVTPTTILMAYTLNPNSGRNVEDYFMDGAIDCFGFDYYMNPLKGKDNPEERVAEMVQVALASGANSILLGEAGVPREVAEDVRVDLLKRLRATLETTPEAVAACYWSTDAFIFTQKTADAWFGTA